MVIFLFERYKFNLFLKNSQFYNQHKVMDCHHELSWKKIIILVFLRLFSIFYKLELEINGFEIYIL